MERILYVSDLDGTLLNRDSYISEKSVSIINSLIDKGMLLTYATARSLSSASIVAKGLTANIPIIAYNGAFIFKADTGEILSDEKISERETAEVIDVLDKCCISPLVYAFVDGIERVSWITANENDGIRHYLNLRSGDKRLRPVSSKSELYEGEVFYFTCIGDEKELLPVYEALSKDERYRCTFQQELYRTEFWCEIMSAKATKANAIKKLKKLWNCSRVISFGDAVNDIPMFEISDEAYAVENAVEELKALATGVIGSNDNDGVAEWLSANVIL